MYKVTLVLYCFYFSLHQIESAEHKPCELREYIDGYVCVCNETYCDSMNVEKPQNFGDYVVISSSKAGQRFQVTKGVSFRAKKFIPTVIRAKRLTKKKPRPKSKPRTVELTIDREHKYQTIVGFGGAFTGTVSYLFDQMSTILRQTLYNNYYSQNDGISYTMMRIPIGGCDFDLEPWAYNENPQNDRTLSNFTCLDDRDSHRIEQINELKRITKNENIKLIGAAWSPPRWMKTNNAWTGLGTLKTEFYQTWADYHLQFLRLMAEKNVHFWAISTGNEPLNGVIGWFFIHFMSLGWLPENQGKWIAENLGPSVNNSEFRNVKLFAGDDQRYTYPWWFEKMEHADGKNAMDFVSGLAVHWYWDRLVPPQLLDKTHEKYPGKILLNTESCIGDKPFEKHGPALGSWSRAEKYALGIIQDLQHSISGWIDWNLVLDESGGPSYVNNTVDAAIILNTITNNEFYKQPIFYVIGHFSKFIPPGSVRIKAELSGFESRHIKTVAFLCPDDIVSVILYNDSDKPKIVHYTDDLRGSYEIEIQQRSISTFVFV